MPGRTLDPDDAWTKSFIEISDLGRSKGKQVCLHTHFNHPNEITWVTKQAANHLYKHGVIVRNQSVLLKGVNDDVKTMCSLITSLASLNIRPVSLRCTVTLRRPRILHAAVHSTTCVVSLNLLVCGLADAKIVLRVPMRPYSRK